MLTGNDPLFEGDVKIEQTVEGHRICVGICNIRVARKVQFTETGQREQEREEYGES